MVPLDIVCFTVYTYCKGNCYSTLNTSKVIYHWWGSSEGSKWLWYWVGLLLWRGYRWVIWQWKGLSTVTGCSGRKWFWVSFFRWWWARSFLTFYSTFGSQKMQKLLFDTKRNLINRMSDGSTIRATEIFIFQNVPKAH